jgi:hypothetical protein
MLLGSFVSDHLLLRDFGPYLIIFTNVYVILTVAMAWGLFVVKKFWSLCDLHKTGQFNTVKKGLICIRRPTSIMACLCTCTSKQNNTVIKNLIQDRI